MPSDYAAIREENRAYYGTGVGEYGPRLLTGLYDDRTHFIFEVLQNAEDALARRKVPATSRAVTFDIQNDALLIRHYGDPFNEADVRSICRIAESSKKSFTDIGKFGIGFKSVYAYTDRPEIHSGEEHFAINDLVIPSAIPSANSLHETLFILPFNKPIVSSSKARGEIAGKLSKLDMHSLLFLQHAGDIYWKIDSGNHGRYWKETKNLEEQVREVRLSSTNQSSEDWLIFSQPVTHKQKSAGKVEIAFSIRKNEDAGNREIIPTEKSPLFSFFPTVVDTGLSFFIHGPYRTTPSRDNIPANDYWNIHLINETAKLLRKSILWLRDSQLITEDFLDSLPLQPRSRWAMFDPISVAAQDVIRSERVLPREFSGYVSVKSGKIGTEDVRGIINSEQLTSIISSDTEQFWMSEKIGQFPTPILYKFLNQDCGISVLNLPWVLKNLTQEFLERQGDEWIQALYACFHGRRFAKADLDSAPLIRLESGRHVQPITPDGLPSAYLPTDQPTSFPTVRASVCESEEAVAFLKDLGFHEADQVADILQHIIPKYRDNQCLPNKEGYDADIRRIISAFDTASRQRKDTFLSGLRDAPFIRAVDSVERIARMVPPGSAYWPTKDILTLLSGVPGVLFVDIGFIAPDLEHSFKEVLASCGTMFRLQPNSFSPNLSNSERRELRISGGHEEKTWNRPDSVSDWEILHLANVLEILPLSESIPEKTDALWNLLGELYAENSSVFHGQYTWYHYSTFSTQFDAAFIKNLQSKPWIIGADGILHRPSELVFDDLSLTPHPDLQKQIGFKPAAIAELAELAGFEPEVLDHLKALGITNMEELRKILPRPTPMTQPHSPPNAADDMPQREQRPYSRTPGKETTAGDIERRTRSSSRSQGTHSPGRPHAQSEGFISYVQVHPGERDAKPSDAERQRRLDLERMAVEAIHEREPNWIVAPPNTPGYDLYRLDEHEEAVEWCEVKALSGSLDDSPVRVSRTQFDFAREKGTAFWLYVVEHAGDADQSRILKIQDPAGMARTFTFDRGWRDVALKD